MNFNKLFNKFSLSFLFVLLFATQYQAKADVEIGQQLFRVHCQSCHNIGSQLIGPDLKGATERHEEEWLLKFIRNSQEVIKSGDEYAVAIYEKFNKVLMPPVTISNDEIKSILSYIEHQSQVLAEASEKDASNVVAQKTTTSDDSGLSGILNYLSVGLIILLVIILLTTLQIFNITLRLNDVKSGFSINWQKVNTILMPAFLIIGFAAIIYEVSIHSEFLLLSNSASAHGESLDNMFNITLIITGIVFVITHILLFVFAAKYRHQKNKKAYFYPDNHKLEIFWTVIPAIVLTILVMIGFFTWKDVMYEKETDAELPVVEVLAQQFAWFVRYPGESGVLGKTDYTLFSHNNLGLDFSDENAQDDILSYELVLPVNQEVILRLRSKDVLHSAYFPHFRMQMYTVPGMPTQFRFTPTITTKEMRKILDNENFNYELACNQICGVAHYNMRMIVRIVEPEEYQTWIRQQKPYYENFAIKGTEESEIEIDTEIDTETEIETESESNTVTETEIETDRKSESETKSQTENQKTESTLTEKTGI